MAKYTIDKSSFSKREEKTLKFWEESKIFETSVQMREKAPYFTFYDGPPFATGLPHYGHLLAGTIKDVIPRYKTMKGFYVPRRFGWDCHGLPIENEIEKAHNLGGAKSIEAFGIDRFNEECRNIVLRYTNEWKTSVNRMGRWVDFDNTYRTMDLPYMESVWWVFNELYKKGLIYEGYKVMPFSAKLGTPLSNFEAGENYKEVDDPALTVEFALKEDPKTALLAWTTTPWTLISNLALMVGPDIDYVKVKEGERFIVLAKSRLAAYFKDQEVEIVETFKGSTLVGKHYTPILPYFKEHDAFRIIGEEGVSLDDGTGIVHSAPAFGEVDFYACQKENITLVCPVDNNGQFTAEVPEYEGLFVKDADKAIIKRLKQEGKIFHQGVIRHRYPFCWRSDTPLIYKAVSSWFVAVEKIKEELIASNNQTHWTPEYLKLGRFGKWLEGARDWCISRNRYWGTPIPLWRSESGKIKVVESVQELESLTGETITDIHRHFIDDLTFTLEGEEYKRINPVFDCWFESGSMPYAQNHYPFENKEAFQNHFPADFIAEGLDQTRGWFYTLTILSTALFKSPAFKNVIVNGIVLAEDGQKMSKRLRNYPDPMEVTHQYGADAIRLYLLNSPAVRADDLCFTSHGVELVLRQVLIPFWNSYAFFATYATIYDWKPTSLTKEPKALIDRWILSTLHRLIHKIELGMDRYHLQMAVEPLVGFIDQLTNWYIRRSRRRFWSSEASQDRDEAFSTLYQVLITLSKLSAPFVPFISDEIYRELGVEEMPISVHLTDYPTYDASIRDLKLETSMEAAQTVVSLGHALRKEHKLKVRQPLQTAYIASQNKHLLEVLTLKQDLILDELNVKQVLFSEDETDFVRLKGKPNFRTVGKRVGKKMPLVQKIVQELDQQTLQSILDGASTDLNIDGEVLTFTPDEIQVEREVKEGVIAGNAGEITIALDPLLTPPLILEGLSREMVNKLNTMRRDAEFDVSDRIGIQIEATDAIKEAYEIHKEYIVQEVLATEVAFTSLSEGTEWDLNGEKTKIMIFKKT
ncbi:isoleucine--tRNA ligase [Chlamydiales bacterium]|nr:isoleucine--tRNA ligase [Chlamydiales bacterium]